MSKTDDQEHDRCATDNAPRLLNLDEAVEFLRGAYARRTLQNMVWKGQIRCIGRGRRMRFLPSWLLEDLQTYRVIGAGAKQGEIARGNTGLWSLGEATRKADGTSASVHNENATGGPKGHSRNAKKRPRFGAEVSGSRMKSASDSSSSSDRKRKPRRFFDRSEPSIGGG